MTAANSHTNTPPLILGLDIGSVSVGLATLTPDKTIRYTDYAFHHGDLTETVEKMLEKIETARLGAVAATHATPSLIDADWRCDDRIAVIAAAQHFCKRMGAILHVGGETFSLLHFDEHGRYRGLKTNTSCAAGTGSFLDQQAGRLNLSGIGELAKIAAANTGQLPKIASRCAVFAKTDLIHAQQEGYGLGEICDGLCRGLARNIVDTVFKHEIPSPPVVFCGGVAQNQAVIAHLNRMLGRELTITELAPLYGAVGAALNLLREKENPLTVDRSKRPVFQPFSRGKTYGHSPLALHYTAYPDFAADESYEYQAGFQKRKNTVEVDVYRPLPDDTAYTIFLGIDIGSTSTKAVWLTPAREVLSGFYTRTAGRPVAALCSLLEAMDDLSARRGISLKVAGAGTTGSGRKFVGKLVGADLILDEISAHARAARELHPEVDTIIEIGGQDAKFTTLHQGQVTFSTMNTVCAAGTGSFLEEQAEKLGVPLAAYAERTENIRAPITSDRCTVFMERDINHYLSRGYTVPEVLTAALHAIRENYLTKVAARTRLGQTICFQGATAKNRALVAAFEQRLQRPLHVSRYCHLTGALGVALYLAEDQPHQSNFRGMDLYKTKIPVRSEICDLCPNHCKITVADLADGPVAYGFLCGRDYETRHFVDNNRSGFDLCRARRKAFRPHTPAPETPSVTVGIPAGLYLQEESSLWVDFFHRLGMQTITSRGVAEVMEKGKAGVGAEFCAPITAMHGHVIWLLERAEVVFLPYYLDNRKKDGDARRQYCYYSQFIPTLLADLAPADQDRLISPVLKFLYTGLHQRLELHRSVQKIDNNLGFFEVMNAYERALHRWQESRKQWQKRYDTRNDSGDDIRVMFLGRPYTVLDPEMNKSIPQIFGTSGIKGFSQDMLDLEHVAVDDIAPFLEELHWNYAADIIKAARVVADTPGTYPVLLTSFKCAPDSFIRDVFQTLMEGAEKPYLILELDEHGSSVGYETRIESAVRTFRNHAAAQRSVKTGAGRINPAKVPSLAEKILVLPNWDPLTCPLLVANLQREGLDARLLEENPGVIKRSLHLNSGQCLPINIMVQEFVEYMKNQDLDPEHTVLWMGGSEVPCNIRLYPYAIKNMLAAFGGRTARAGVYTGTIAFTDISLRAAMNGYFAFMFGGLLRRMGCRVRPYEHQPGETDQALVAGRKLLEQAFRGERDKETAVIEMVERFAGIQTIPDRRPQVAIFGDLYVRDNPVFNQDLIALIEACGGEALTTPYTEYAKMIAPAYFKKWFTEGKFLNLLISRGLLTTMVHREKAYYRHFRKILQEPEPHYDRAPQEILAEFAMVPEQTGESLDNILKIYYLCRHHPDLALFVQTSPAFCCPSLITEAMSRTIEKQTGVPMVSITYDGTGGEKNRKIIPYLKLL